MSFSQHKLCQCCMGIIKYNNIIDTKGTYYNNSINTAGKLEKIKNNILYRKKATTI